MSLSPWVNDRLLKPETLKQVLTKISFHMDKKKYTWDKKKKQSQLNGTDFVHFKTVHLCAVLFLFSLLLPFLLPLTPHAKAQSADAYSRESSLVL